MILSNTIHPESEAMTTESKASSSNKAAQENTPAEASSTSTEQKIITPAERWLLIREKAQIRAQKRGFVGGNPFEDWLEAEEEIDAKYDTDFRGVFAQTDAAEIT